MKDWLKMHRLCKMAMAFLMGGMIWAVSLVPVLAAERTVRLNIPACMS